MVAVIQLGFDCMPVYGSNDIPSFNTDPVCRAILIDLQDQDPLMPLYFVVA